MLCSDVSIHTLLWLISWERKRTLENNTTIWVKVGERVFDNYILFSHCQASKGHQDRKLPATTVSCCSAWRRSILHSMITGSTFRKHKRDTDIPSPFRSYVCSRSYNGDHEPQPCTAFTQDCHIRITNAMETCLMTTSHFAYLTAIKSNSRNKRALFSTISIVTAVVHACIDVTFVPRRRTYSSTSRDRLSINIRARLSWNR